MFESSTVVVVTVIVLVRVIGIVKVLVPEVTFVWETGQVVVKYVAVLVTQ